MNLDPTIDNITDMKNVLPSSVYLNYKNNCLKKSSIDRIEK